jgi:hypothetical protein
MLILLAISLIILTLFVIISLIRTKFNSIIIIIVTPFLLFNIGFGWHTINELWGSAKHGFPKEEVEIVAVHMAKPEIFVVIKRKEDQKIRLHAIPATKENEKRLSDAKEKIKKGQRMMAKGNDENNNDSQDVIVYKWNHMESLPK